MLSTITSVSVDNICVNTPASLIKQKGNKICHKTRLFEITSLVSYKDKSSSSMRHAVVHIIPSLSSMGSGLKVYFETENTLLL